MIKAFEVLGITVVSLQDGDEVGTVSKLLTDRSGRVIALALEQQNWYDPIRVIPFEFVTGVSKDAVMVENASSVYMLSELPELINILKASPELLGLPVLTKSGKALGIVAGYSIDEKSGKIEEYTVSKPGESGQAAVIPADRVFAIGKKVVVVSV